MKRPFTISDGLVFRIAATAFLLLLSAARVGAQASHATPATYFFLVFSDPAPGTESEYNRWYNDEHAPDVTSIPGFVSSRRYVLAEQQLRAVSRPMPHYLVVYRIVTNDLPAVKAEIERRARNGMTRMSPTLTNPRMYTYREFRPEQKGASGEAADARPGASHDYLQVVFGDATPGQEADFNHWYDTEHEPQLLAVSGFVRGERGILSPQPLAPTDPKPSQYLAMFEMHTRDLAAVLRPTAGLAPPPPSFDRARTFGYTYRAITPVYDGNAIRRQRAAVGSVATTPR